MIVRPDKAVEDEFRKAVSSVATEWRAAKPRNERVYQAFIAELAQVRAGK